MPDQSLTGAAEKESKHSLFARLALLLLRLAVTLALASVIIFSLVITTSDPSTALRLTPGVNAEDVARIEKSQGLDVPPVQRFGIWISGLSRGDLGESFTQRRPVSQIILERLPVTLLLAGSAFVLAFVLSLFIGGLQARVYGGAVDSFMSGGAFALMSTPVFWLALMLQLVLGYGLSELLGVRVFFTAGAATPGHEGEILDGLMHLGLPLLTLVLAQTAVWSRYQREAMVGALGSSQVVMARGLGIPERTVSWRYALPAALPMMISYASADLAMLFGGAVVTESVFAWPGMGSLLIASLGEGDHPLILGILISIAGLVIVTNTAASALSAHLRRRGRLS